LTAVLAATANTSTNVQTGVLAFLVVAGMGIVLFFLLRSMNKQFRKLGPGDEETPK
jgi:predicted RND superfamily exporter protein